MNGSGYNTGQTIRPRENLKFVKVPPLPFYVFYVDFYLEHYSNNAQKSWRNVENYLVFVVIIHKQHVRAALLLDLEFVMQLTKRI